MATKKKTKNRRKTRRVGGIGLKPDSMITKVLAVAAGYFLLADPINDQLDKLIPKKTPDPDPAPATTVSGMLDNVDLVGVGETGVGAALLFMGKSSLLKTLAGGILVGAGVKRLTSADKAIKGYQSTPVIGYAKKRLAGYQSTPVIGKVPAQLQGLPGQLQGYRVNGYQSAGSGAMGSMELNNQAGSGVAVGSSAGYMR